MDRRKFIKASLVAASAPVAAKTSDSDRLYGVPASVDASAMSSLRFALPLVDAGVQRQR